MSPELKLDDIEQIEAWVAEQLRDSMVIDLRDGESQEESWSELVDTTESISYLAKVRINPPVLRDRGHRARIRALDLVVAILVGLLVLPIVLIIALGIKLSSKGPLFFRQVRIGRSGVPFYCWKFRSMHVDASRQLNDLLEDPERAEEWEHSRKLVDDPRITPIGKLLRRTDLDELPQLWNVIRGEMSLVGPRPVPSDEAELYEDDLRTVLSVHPGMTGLWQVSGRNSLPYEERVVLDCGYVQDQGLWTNVIIGFRTCITIIGFGGRHA